MTIPPALRYRRFLLYWLGIVFAMVAYQILIWTVPWHVRSFTNQPIALGAIGLIRVLPIIGVSVFAGMVADMFSRRKVLFMTQGAMGMAALGLGILTFKGEINLIRIYLLVAVLAFAFSFDLPARQSLVPNLVPRRVLANAYSLESISFAVGGLAGPALSGFLIARLGQMSPYLVSAFCYTLMLTALVLIGPVKQESLLSHATFDFAAIRTGIRFTFRHPLILSSMLLDFLATLFTRADTLMPIFARDILGVGPVAYGWLSSAQAIGGSLAGAALSQLKVVRRQGPILLASAVMIGVGAVVFGLSRNFWLSLGALIVVGTSDGVSSIIRSTIRQLQTPDRLRGRMVGVNQIFFMGGPQLGELKSGVLGQLLGVSPAVVLGGIACVLSSGWVAQRWSMLKLYNGDEPVLKISVD